MIDQPKPTTGEWTAEYVGTLWTEDGTSTSFYRNVADSHNVALAAERSAKDGFRGLWNTAERQRSHLEKELNRVTDDAGKLVQQLREQLAVALVAIKRMQGSANGDFTQVQKIGDAAIAKIGGK